MTDWRDTLPPIPSERILNDVIREGGLRQDRRRKRRQRVMVFGGSVAAVAAVVVGVVLTNGTDQDKASPTAPPLTAHTTAAAATTAPAVTGGGSQTTAAGAATTAGGATATTTPTTELASGTTQVPVTAEVAVSPGEIWERAANGVECGPTTVEVTFRPQNTALQSAMVVLGEPGNFPPVEMTVTDDRATATLGPYDPETLDGGTERVLTITVGFVDTAGHSGLVRSTQTVTLHDCPP